MTSAKTCHQCLTPNTFTFHSPNYCHAILPVPCRRHTIEEHILLISLHDIHRGQLWFPCTCYSHCEEGPYNYPLPTASLASTYLQASNTGRVLYSLIVLAVLNFLLTFSTYTHPAAGGFFVFVLLNAIGQAAAGSYLQTAVVAIASLFGPSAMQAVMSGQAAVAVAISGVQVVSAVASVRGSEPATTVASSEPEEQSAFVFFGLSTFFLLVSVGVNAWLVSLPAYKAVASQRFTRRPSTAEGTSLLATSATDDVHDLRKPEHKNYVLRLAKTNVTFNVAVAYVFIVTLVRLPPSVPH